MSSVCDQIYQSLLQKKSRFTLSHPPLLKLKLELRLFVLLPLVTHKYNSTNAAFAAFEYHHCFVSFMMASRLSPKSNFLSSLHPSFFRQDISLTRNHTEISTSVNRSDPLTIEGHVLTNQVLQRQHRTLANALAGGPQNVRLLVGERSAIREYQYHIFNVLLPSSD